MRVPNFRDLCAALPEEKKESLTPEIVAMIPDALWELSRPSDPTCRNARAVDRAEIQPAMLMAAVQAIDGLETEDGGKYTAAMLCDAGPDELFNEVAVAINRNAYLSKEKTENLSLPTLPGEQGSGPARNSTATNAN